MAVIDTPRTIAGGHHFGGRFNRIVAAFAAWNAARVTRNALGKLSDHELADIGLVRGDIDRIA